MAKYRYRRRHQRRKAKQPSLGIPGIVGLVAIGLALVAGSFFSIDDLTKIAWILAGVVVAIVFLIGLAFIVYKRKQAQKWKLFKLADIDQMGGIEFEHYLAKLLRALKYEEVTVTQGQGDFGVDILYQKDGQKYAAQVKRKKGYVGVDALYQAVGGRDFYKADQAVVITNSTFSRSAQIFAQQSNVILVDRSKLAEWIVEAEQLTRQLLSLPITTSESVFAFSVPIIRI